MKKFCRLFYLLLLPGVTACFAQGENNIWTFGLGRGFDFSTGEPVPIQTEMRTSEGCASVCDAAGRLLFYSSGDHVWDRQHQEMPNSPGLLGNSGGFATIGSSTQGTVIVPDITDSNLYYLFTTDPREARSDGVYPGYLRYSVIDMRLNNGRGDVDISRKNIILDDSVSEDMTAVRGEGCYFWLLTHKYGTNQFRAFRVSASGVDTVPVTSAVSNFNTGALNQYSYTAGQMKASADGSLLAVLNNAPRSVELYSFDNGTGIVSNPGLLYSVPGPGYMFGLSFSPDDSKLYFVDPVDGRNSIGGKLYQFDLSGLPDTEAVRRSGMKVGDDSVSGAMMRLGPDGKIYISSNGINLLTRINRPDLRGAACGVERMRFTGGVVFTLSFGTEFLGRKRPQQSRRSDTVLCDATPMLLLRAPSGYDHYIWDDGSTLPQRSVTGSSLAWVVSTDLCRRRIDTFQVKVRSCNSCVAFPTAFTPNSDGRNDIFRPLSECPVLNYRLMVYNRWGQQVFVTYDLHNGWDGRLGGVPAEIGTYYYDCSIQMRESDAEHYKGEVTLIR